MKALPTWMLLIVLASLSCADSHRVRPRSSAKDTQVVDVQLDAVSPPASLLLTQNAAAAFSVGQPAPTRNPATNLQQPSLPKINALRPKPRAHVQAKEDVGQVGAGLWTLDLQKTVRAQQEEIEELKKQFEELKKQVETPREGTMKRGGKWILAALKKVVAKVKGRESDTASDSADIVNVVVVGAGVPKRGMGWYHAKQILDSDVPSAKLLGVVEPWFLGDGADSPPGKMFKEWVDEESKNGVGFYKSVGDLPAMKGKTLALISGRTADNPRLLKEVIAAGCTHVFLEKPGAPTVGELEEMKAYAASKGVPVWMGYNKNVSPYVLQALEVQEKTPGSSMTFIHNNAYKEEELPECFERNAEGMLKNMAIHELALLATYYGVTVENIDSVDVDKEYSSCQTLKGPGGSEFTDFAKVGFTVTTKDGKSVTVKADRCGSDEGGNSIAVVSAGGEEKFRVETPDEELKKICEEKTKQDPDMMPYFNLQHDDYITLKERATAHMASGEGGAPEGMATLDIAIDALKVAEYLTPLLQEASKK